MKHKFYITGKAIFCFVLSVMLTLGMLPGMMRTVEAASYDYDLHIAGADVTDRILSGVGTGGGTWSFSPGTNTLTLDSLVMKGGYSPSETSSGVIYYTGRNDLTIVLKGNSSLESTFSNGNTPGMYFQQGTITIQGDGSLTCQGGTGTTSYAIHAYNLTIKSGTVNATGGEASGTYGKSSGIYVNKGLIIEGGQVNATGGATSGTDGQSTGIYADFSGNDDKMIIKGGQVTATGGSAIARSYGICGRKTISGGIVNATGGSVSGESRYSCGIIGETTISGGSVKATGGTASGANGGSTGISGYLLMDGGTLEATGGSASSGRSKGISSSEQLLRIKSGVTKVIATGNDSAVTGDDVKSEVDGKGWTNTAGTTGETAIAASTSPLDLSPYKKVQFPATPTTYTVTVTNDGHGTASADVASGAEGTEVTLTATPSEGYRFKEWLVVSGAVTVTDNKFTIGTANVEVKAIFELIPTYTVTVTNDGHGTASADIASGAEGTEVTLTATPSEGYRFKEWQVVSGGITVTNNKFTIGTANVEVKAIFELIPTYTVTVTNDSHGTASADVTSGIEGTEVTLTATPSEGYRFKEWQVVSGGVTITENKFSIGTANVEVKAVFELVTAEYTLFSVTGTTEGESHTWTKGNTNDVDMTVKLNGTVDNSYAHFTGVQLGGTKLTKGTDYDAHEGSTVVTLKAAMLEKLSVGAYTVSILFDDGQVDTTLTIKAAATPTATATPTAAPTPSPTPAPTSTPRPVPQTGDSDHPVLWIGLILLGIAGLAALAAIKVSRKRK